MWFLLLACTRDVPISGHTGEETDDTAPPVVEIVSNDDLTLALDDDVVTMVRATWDASRSEARVEYHLADDDWTIAPTVEPGSAVILGATALTDVTARLVDPEGASDALTIRTGTLPHDLPEPRIDAWEPDLAHPAAYAMISVASGRYTFSPPFWIEIFDRQGRVVWYQEVPDQMMVFYPSVTRDGTHIWHDAGDPFDIGQDIAHVVRQTLDGRWSARIDVADMGQAVGEGPDGTFFYERRTSHEISVCQVDADGVETTIWDCSAWAEKQGIDPWQCYLNATNWSERTGTVLASSFTSDTVFEVDVATGDLVRQMGRLTVGDPYTFSPTDSAFSYQHWPVWTDAGTLLISTHDSGASGTQIAAEYIVDDDTKTLTRTWSYVSTDRWATQLGEANRLDNGNTVQGYGQDGAAREVTSDGRTAWEVSWDKDDQGYRVVGHLTLIDDLYALNAGPAE